MISIYGLQPSNFVRSVALVCAQKQQAYQIDWKLGDKEIPFRSNEHLAVHPFAKMPIIQDGELIVQETLAICRYLDAKYPAPALQPEGIEQQAEHDAWCSMIVTQIDQAIMRKYLVEFAFPTGPDGKPNKEKLMKNKPQPLRAVEVVEQRLAGKDYICGDQFTLADALLVPMLHHAAKLKYDLQLIADDSPIHAYIERALAQPGAKDILL